MTTTSTRFQMLIDYRLRYPCVIHGQGWHEGTHLGMVFDWLLERGLDEDEAADELLRAMMGDWDIHRREANAKLFREKQEQLAEQLRTWVQSA